MKLEINNPRGPAKLRAFEYFLCKLRRSLDPVWPALGAIESWALRKPLHHLTVDRPIYITGMARTGTTITLECLSRHPDVATHRYRDMVQPHLPFVWNWLMDRLPLPVEIPQERVCQDGIFVTRESPEAVEEALWMRFFTGLHDEQTCSILEAGTSQPAFERHYESTIRKLLLARQRRRYVTKADDNVTRLAYLARLFPGARFIVMVRHPHAHFASWIKMHELYMRIQQEDRRWFEVIRWVGHHAFGIDQRFINVGGAGKTTEIRQAWDRGNRALAFGLYWSSIYGHVLDLAESNPLVREATIFVRHEDLCASPRETIDRMLAHTGLDMQAFAAVREHYAGKLAQPRYYRAQLDDDEALTLTRTTDSVASRLGYTSQSMPGASPQRSRKPSGLSDSTAGASSGT